MKKLIIILFLLVSSICYTQDDSFRIKQDTLWNYTEILTIVYFLELLDEYADSCYADSTQKSGWVLVTFDTEDGGKSYGGYDEYQSWQEHKEPSFNGFREFLRRKQ